MSATLHGFPFCVDRCHCLPNETTNTQTNSSTQCGAGISCKIFHSVLSLHIWLPFMFSTSFSTSIKSNYIKLHSCIIPVHVGCEVLVHCFSSPAVVVVVIVVVVAVVVVVVVVVVVLMVVVVLLLLFVVVVMVVVVVVEVMVVVILLLIVPAAAVMQEIFLSCYTQIVCDIILSYEIKLFDLCP